MLEEVNFDVPTTGANCKFDNHLNDIVKLSDWIKMVLFSIIVIANLVFFINWGLKMFKVVKDTILVKMPKIYLYFFACNRKHVMERDLKR